MMQEYEVEIAGMPHTLLLDEDEAKRLDVKPVESKARAPQNKAAAPANKGA